MKYPNFVEEKKLRRKGYKLVAGLDEAGRGPLAGPVVAAAVIVKNSKSQTPKKTCQILNFKSQNLKLLKIKDSKKLSEQQREYFYKILINHKDIKWGIGIVSEKIIDKINILEATKLAMKKALRQTQGKLKRNADYLILDGNFKIDVNILQKSVVKGDTKVFSCCVAGIIAKVTRDRIMKKYHKKYPKYGFSQHKGYPTKAHFANLRKFGPCRIHRKSFYPVSSLGRRRPQY